MPGTRFCQVPLFAWNDRRAAGWEIAVAADESALFSDNEMDDAGGIRDPEAVEILA
jgi:hypothetical protein